MTRVGPLSLAMFLAFGLINATSGFGQSSQADSVLRYGKPTRLAVLEDKEIHESSGLSRSWTVAGAFWTHNDSGDRPRLFLVDRSGTTLATCSIRGAKAIDWEDMCSFQVNDTSYLLVGDVGDNGARRSSVSLYLIKEPEVKSSGMKIVKSLPLVLAIPFTFRDGARDCEAIAVDVSAKRIYLIDKQRRIKCSVYELPLPLTKADAKQPLIAQPIANLNVPFVTGMDISPDGKRAVVLTYLQAFQYVRRDNEKWSAAFKRPPEMIRLPLRRQGETICFGDDGKTLVLTSEGASQPLWEISPTSD